MAEERTYKRIPALRFPEFKNDGEWEVKKLGEIVEVVNDKCSIDGLDVATYISTENMLQNFEGVKKASKLPDTGSFTRFKKGDILFSNIRPYLKKVWKAEFNGAASNDVMVFRALNDFDNEFVEQLIKSDDFIAYTMSGAKGVKMPRGDKKLMLDYTVLIPHLDEQHHIAACLSASDEMLTTTNVKLEQLKAHKKGLMQKLFPAKDKKMPELRFKEFEKDGEWGENRLGEVTKVVNRRNKSNRNLPIYSISNKDGFILQSEQFDGLDSVSRGYDTSLYKIVTSNTFAYNPARINVGSIGYSGNIKECLVSSLYVCFKTTEEIDDSFLMYFFDTSSFNQSVENNVEGGIRSYLFYENFSMIKILLPTILEQKKIASCLKTVDEEIHAISDKATELEKQKKGLLQKLFPMTKNN